MWVALPDSIGSGNWVWVALRTLRGNGGWIAVALLVGDCGYHGLCGRLFGF